MPPSGVDYASEFLNGYAPEYVITITKTFHNISPPINFTMRLQLIGHLAAYAKALGDENLFNQAKNAYMELSNGWDLKMEAEAKQKSHIDWLGRGDYYTVSKSNQWDRDFNDEYEEIKNADPNLLRKGIFNTLALLKNGSFL